jgi:hypothetical protein
MSAQGQPKPGGVLEVIRHGHSRVRCPRCHRWADSLLVLEAEGRPAEALLLCSGCADRARGR